MIDEKGSCSRFQVPQKGQKFGFWTSKKLKILQTICPLVIFDNLSQNYDSFTLSSGHFQKNLFTREACDIF